MKAENPGNNKIRDPLFLIIGASGLIGQSMMDNLRKQNKRVVGTSTQSRQGDLLSLNIKDKSSVERVLDDIRPDWVILATNLRGGVGYCERHPEEAGNFHHKWPCQTMDACRRRNIAPVYISTECVFDGTKEVYSEADKRHPLNEYGRWKAETEQWMQTHLDRYLIVRTMSVFGWQPETTSPNAVMALYFSLKSNKTHHVPAYRWGTPTYVHDLANAIIELTEKDESGIYHITGETYLSRFEWMQRVCRKMGWDVSMVRPESDPPKDQVPYPLKIRLDTQKFRQSHATVLRDLDDALGYLAQEMKLKV